jgi:excisionase family DNA binding protein
MDTTDKGAMGVEGACRYLDVSRPTLYRLMDTGAVPSFHIGRRRLILREHLDRFLHERLAEAEAGR